MSTLPKEPMTSAYWQRVKEIVADALEVNPDERAALVDAVCADDSVLHAEVNSLLQHAGEKRQLEVFAEDLSWSHEERRDARLGQAVGSYRIVDGIGRGGMGAVYLGERADQEFEKRVAVKILKRGTDTDEVLHRFQRERQILAQLAHPNIAHLLDAGTTEDGLPFFAMEYVKGTPITDFCDTHHLDVRRRVELFLKVCGAVQFAHRNLIVHRDIKPGNILITAEGEPKLLDFGIAKLLAPETAHIQLTINDRQRLTPGYAAPEQVRGEAVTTASDVYALGALLYELLTGQPPHRFSTSHPSETELQRVIVEGDAATASSMPAQPERRRELRGDLDNILITALRKEPERRYSGVAAFADDLHRHLDGRPVRARQDTVRYRTSKFIRRNRLGVAAAALVVLALFTGLAGTAWQAHVAQVERAKAEHRFNQVRQLARSVLFDYHDAIAALPGSTAVREKLVKDALQYLDNLSQEAGADRSLLRELADAYEKVAAVLGGNALSNRGTTLTASNLGDAQGGLAIQRKALAIRETLARLSPGDTRELFALARAYNTIGTFVWAVGTPQETVERFRQGISKIEPLLARDPANEDLQAFAALSYVSLGKALGSPAVPNIGDTAGAFVYVRKALARYEELARSHPANLSYQQSFFACYNGLGLLHGAAGQVEEQLAANERALEINRALVAAEPANNLYQRELAVQLGNLGSTRVQLKDKLGSLPYFREALAIFEGLVAADPNDIGIRRALAVGHRNIGVVTGGSDAPGALRHLEKATDILAQLVVKDPTNNDFRRQWAFTHLATSRFHLETEMVEAAAASALEGVRIEEALVASSPSDVAAQNTLALLYTQLGTSRMKQASSGQTQTESWRHARDAYAKSLALYQALKTNGKLSGADAGKPDELAREIAACDTALAR